MTSHLCVNRYTPILYLGDVVEHEPHECGGPQPRRLFLPMGVMRKPYKAIRIPAISVSKVASNKSSRPEDLFGDLIHRHTATAHRIPEIDQWKNKYFFNTVLMSSLSGI